MQPPEGARQPGLVCAVVVSSATVNEQARTPDEYPKMTRRVTKGVKKRRRGKRQAWNERTEDIVVYNSP